MFTRSISAWAAVLGFLIPMALPPAAWAQDKPKERRNTATVTDDNTRKVIEAANVVWEEAYPALGQPLLLFVFGLESDDPAESVGLGLAGDQLEYTTEFANGIGQLMQAAVPDTEIENLDAAALNATKVRDQLSQDNVSGFVQDVIGEYGADYIIWCQFVPRPNGRHGVIGRITDGSGKDRNLGGNIEINLGDNTTRKQAIAELYKLIAERFANLAQKTSSQFAANLYGLDFRGVGELRALLNARTGFSAVRPPRMQKDPATGDEIAVVAFRYTGDFFDATFELVDAIETELGATAEPQRAEGGAIVIKVVQAKDEPKWHLLTSETPNSLQDEFKKLTLERGDLRVGILVERYFEDMLYRYMETDHVKLTDVVRSISEIPDESPEASRIANAVASALGNAGVRTIDAKAVYAAISAKLADAGDGTVSGAELERALMSTSEFDVLLLGNVRELVTLPTAEIPPLTFRARTVGANEIIGTASWPDRRASLRPYPVDGADVSQVGRFVAGTLLDEIHRRYLVDGTWIDVEVTGLSGLRQLEAIEQSLARAIPEILSTTGRRIRGDTGTFRLRYAGKMNDLSEQIQRRAESFSFALQTAEMSGSTLQLVVSADPGAPIGHR